MDKEIITCDKAPKAIGPYSQAVKTGETIYISGQIPLDPTTGELVKGDIKEQTKRVMENLNNILMAAGSSLDKVIKTTIYMTDMTDYNAINEVYGSYFENYFPARAAIEVSKLPKDARVEIDAVALRLKHSLIHLI